ncbi:LPS export ABC transporter periplasmic protein LptC [Pseudomonas sp. NW5]|uniref:LPS export ABC transporter periplasmic protein LptC n=1 Tax=Pseudomonas sp. NW5 TaxID=2934934 RepID=UPI00201FD134|nr:LPS export ABC transporter periplasmic protein LptC [Pseudomonas sp. NW5]MCL7461480.1 LPS export ABC transporter periplasmic protein LptC [Pseudomonas sp. NW5]
MMSLSPTLRLGLLALALTTLLAAIGYWNIRPESFMASAPLEEAETIDFYAEKARSIQFQADGSLDYRLTAERLEHVQATDLTRISAPALLLHRGREQPWQVRSQRGEVLPGGDQVELIEQVQVERTDARGRQIRLHTERLSVFPEREFASTAAAVRIEAANGVTTATGLEAYFKDGRMRLLSNVRGQHEIR